MNAVHPRVHVEEVTLVLTPEPGVSIAQMLGEANITSVRPLEIDIRDGSVYVTVYRRVPNGGS